MFLTHVYRLLLLCFLGLSILFSGCKKEDVDEEPPKIFLESPFENQTFSSIDTIFVSAVITDNQNVSSVEVELLTLDNELVTKRQFSFSGTEVNFGFAFEINQPLLSTGQYYFAIRARDGENRSSAFRQILISAIPREIEQYVAITTETNDMRIETSNDLDTWSVRLTRFLDYKGGAMNYRQNIMGVAGGEIGDAEFYNTIEFNQLVSYPGLGTPSIPFFLGLDYSRIGEHFVLLQNEPQARLLDKEGQPLASAPLMTNFLPSKSFGFEDRYFILEKRITNSERFLNLYSLAGLRLKSFTVLGPVIEVFEKDLDEYFVWVAEEDRTVLYELDTNTELFAEVYERQDESLLSVVETGNNVFIFSTDQGIYRYTYSNGGTNPLNDQLSPSQLIYDELNGLIYGIEGQTLFELSATGEFSQAIQFNRDLVFFGIDYNR
jgi:hypothetical protein